MISLCFSIYSGKVLCTLGMVMLLHNTCETVVHYLPRNGYLSMGKRRWKDRKEMMCVLSLVPFPDRCGLFHDLASLFFRSNFKLWLSCVCLIMFIFNYEIAQSSPMFIVSVFPPHDDSETQIFNIS